MNVVAKILIEAIKAESRRKSRTLYNNHKHPKRIRKELFDLLNYEIRHNQLASQDCGHCWVNPRIMHGEPPSIWVWGRLVIPKDPK